MEPTTLATATIAALFTSEAAKAGGKAFGESTSKLVSQLLASIRNKFKDSKTEGVLTMAEEDQTESNINLVKTVLVAQIEKDEEFANRLRELLMQLKETEGVFQEALINVKTKRDLEVGNVSQTSRNSPATQIAGKNLEAENIKIDSISQQQNL